MRPLACFLGGAALLAVSAPRFAAARACGDVDGKGEIPCACGDVLVGSRTLSAADPITQGPCEGDGLIVRIPPSRPGATLGLGGQTISGSGRGIGIHVQSGVADQLTIAGPGVVRSFDVGVLGTGTIRAVEDIVSADHRTDGFCLTGVGFTVSGCEARDNGRAGFVLRGSGYHVAGNRAVGNGADGFSLAGRGAVVAGAVANESAANGAHGMIVAGRNHLVRDVTATGNHGGGLRARVARSAVVAPGTTGNGGFDLSVAGHDSSVDSPSRGASMRLRGTWLDGEKPAERRKGSR